ncbi:MAG TPA: biotin--[acetyl-CoA-carboxylase] ligase [Xanthobacteraceae bacterium]|jgi:BirA family biotin operon repressor/biotin-[acetyl-CoA-carboxylase] ligase
MEPHPIATAAGIRLVAHEALGSTNAEALSLARRGECGPLWVVAARQTEGRGRRGRRWASPPGNLYASLLLTAPALPGACVAWPQLSLVAALAVHDAIAACARPVEPALFIKWPNDILLRGAKLAGILVEAEVADAPAVAIGVGVNCVSHPPDTDYPATDLAAAGAPVTPAALLADLSVRMMQRLAQWAAGAGFSIVRDDWIARAARLGEDIRVRVGDRDLSGRFDTLDAAGNMILRLPDGRAATVTAGDTLYADILSDREHAG